MISPSNGTPALLLFEAGRLIDANAAGRDFLREYTLAEPDWSDVAHILVKRFKDFPIIQGGGNPRLQSFPSNATPEDPQVFVEQWDDQARLELRNWCEGSEREEQVTVPRSEWQALQLAAEAAPYPIWQADADGKVLWRNPAYAVLAQKAARQDDDAMALFDLPSDQEQGSALRCSVTIADRKERLWFDITLRIQDGTRLYYAQSAKAAVSAELAQRNFVQTLTKTFAQLSIGLAIFDRDRQLVLFNPALVDLTTLPAAFLSARPTIMSFFDRMRENRIMPEPKDYTSWRKQIGQLMEAASDGRMSETWTLPSGLTYRVTGRPHPDGAIALLFEDITAEISLTRRFRSDLELGQSVLDSLDQAVVVVSPLGHLSFSNRAFRELWGIDPDSSFAEFTLRDTLSIWRDKCTDSHVWKDILNYTRDFNLRRPWASDITLKSGERLPVRLSPLSGGSTLILFEPAIAAPKLKISAV